MLPFLACSTHCGVIKLLWETGLSNKKRQRCQLDLQKKTIHKLEEIIVISKNYCLMSLLTQNCDLARCRHFVWWPWSNNFSFSEPFRLQSALTSRTEVSVDLSSLLSFISSQLHPTLHLLYLRSGSYIYPSQHHHVSLITYYFWHSFSFFCVWKHHISLQFKNT